MQINEFLDLPVPPCDTWPTGLSELDRVTGGMQAGMLWLVTGHPGQGRTTLITQLAVRYALRHEMFTQLSCPRERPEMVRARLLSLATGRALTYPAPGVGELGSADLAAVQALRRAPLHVEAGNGVMPDWSDVADRPRCLAVDDADQGGSALLAALRSAADAGALVLVSAPRHLVVTGPGWGDPVAPGWAAIADLVLEIDSLSDVMSPPREARILLHRNRWGPLIEFDVLHGCFRARFTDLRA